MGTGTHFSSIALIIIGVVVKMIAPFVLTVLGLPGRWMAFPNASGQCSKVGLIFGTIVTTLLQSYVGLVYTAFVVNWTIFAMQKQGATSTVLFAAFFAVIFPMGSALKDARANMEGAEHSCREKISVSAWNEANERKKILDMAAQASSVTFLLTLVGFFVLLSPKAMEVFCRWVPFI